ncbi:MAG: cobalt ECF transporter T component CbiQ [Acidaminococcaceae bacterium]
MTKLANALYNIRLLDDLAKKDTYIHKLHPLVKLLTTVIYLAVVMSFDRYEISNILPFMFFPLILMLLAELPLKLIVNRLLVVLPLIIGIGILNPIIDNYVVTISGVNFSRGWITFLSLSIKCILSVSAGIILIATTGIDRLAVAMRMIKIPKIFVLQLLLTYRYITVLAEEFLRMTQAYLLRTPEQKGISKNHWGSFAGQLILRTFDRAERVYQAMLLRGFTMEYNVGYIEKASFKDFAYLTGWSVFFIIAKIYNLPLYLESLITGVVK